MNHVVRLTFSYGLIALCLAGNSQHSAAADPPKQQTGAITTGSMIQTPGAMAIPGGLPFGLPLREPAERLKHESVSARPSDPGIRIHSNLSVTSVDPPTPKGPATYKFAPNGKYGVISDFKGGTDGMFDYIPVPYCTTYIYIYIYTKRGISLIIPIFFPVLLCG